MYFSKTYSETTVTDEMKDFIIRMPKVEIHVHLEGSIDPKTTYQMAKQNNVALPVASLDEWETYYAFRDFNHFIDVYMLVSACLKTPDDYVAMVESYMRSQAEHNILYSEVFFSPLLHRNKLSIHDMLEALSEGIRRGGQKYGTQVKLIPDISREMAVDDREAQKFVLNFALQAKECGMALGMGIGGKEIGCPPSAFRDVFVEAHQQGLHIVAHGGETGGAESVWGAIHDLQAERIGHGVQAVSDPELVVYLKEKQIPLEISPQSNYCLGVVAHSSPHPIRQLVDAGVYCTVNTDDPPYFSTDLNNEYLTLAAQGFTLNEIWQLNLNALNAAFLSQNEREELSQRWTVFSGENSAI